MGIVGPQQERRPSINIRGDGGIYLRVYTRRGMRTRQITPDGWAWIRLKYPGYTDPESIPLTYADYWQLKEQRAIHVGRQAEQPQARPRPVESYRNARVAGPHNDTPPSTVASVHAVTHPPSTFTPGGCPGCHQPLAADAAYCPDCGWFKRPVPKPQPEKPNFDGVCTDCKTPLRTDAIFCPRCGKSRFAIQASPIPKATPTIPAPLPAKQHRFKIGWQAFLTMQAAVVVAVLWLIWLAKG